MCKKIMILGASELQLPAIRKAKDMGLECIAVDYDENAVGAKEADTFYNISTLDYESVLEAASKEKIDGIITICSDRPMAIVSKVSRELGLNAISTDAALKATNKTYMRNALFKDGVPVPEYRICKSKDEYIKAVDEIGLPVIVKPSDNAGSRGIVFVDEYKNIDKAYDYSKSNSLEEVVLVEEFMEGAEVSVEAFVCNDKIEIVQITDKITTGAPHFVEMGHTQPSALPEDTIDEIKDVTKKAINSLGIEGGPAHVELKITDKGVKIVELGARLGGDFISTDLVSASTGVDMVRATIAWAMGWDADMKKTKEKFSAVRYVGKLRFIKLEKDVIKLIDSMSWNQLENETIESSRDREGSFIVSDDTREGIMRKIEIIKNALEFDDKGIYW